jgi:polyisoprenyl-phosphate glycosyltransferase
MSDTQFSIDVVIAILNEEKNIVALVKDIAAVLSSRFSGITFIIVDDGSTDQTETEITRLKNIDSSINIKYIRLARNYGKDLALKCGIDHSTSPVCAMIDGDFQHPPQKIIVAHDKILEGHNIVHILKEEYNLGPKYRKLGSTFFSRLISFLSGNNIHLTDFKLLDKKAVKLLRNYKETSYFSAGIIEMIGLSSAEITYKPQVRKYGQSKFSFLRLLRLAIASIISISIKPLRISIYAGIFISLFSFAYSLFIVFEKIFFGQAIPGFPTLAAALFFMGGIQLLFLGILGEYVGKAFIESKNRPQYTIDYITDL